MSALLQDVAEDTTSVEILVANARVSESVSVCARVSESVCVCARVSESVSVCARVLESVSVCMSSVREFVYH